MAVIQFAHYAKGKTRKRPRPVENSTAGHGLAAKLERILDNCDEIKKCNRSLYEFLIKHVGRGKTVMYGNKETDPRIILEVIDFYDNKNFIKVEAILNQITPGGSRVGNRL